MPTPRWVKSRGFSIVAAVIFAAILTSAAVLIQMTVPTTFDTQVAPESQGAQAAGAVPKADAANTIPPGCEKINDQSFFCPDGTPVNMKCRAGQDYTMDRFNKKDPSTGRDVRGWIVTSAQVCKSQVTPSSVSVMSGTSPEGPMAKQVQRCSAGNKIDSPDVPKCKYDSSGALITSTVVGWNDWNCTTRIYDESITDAEKDSSKNRRCYISTSAVGQAPKAPQVGDPVKTGTEFSPETPKASADEVCKTAKDVQVCKNAYNNGLPDPATKTLDDLLKQNASDRDFISKNCNEGASNVAACSTVIQRNVDTISALDAIAKENQDVVKQGCGNPDLEMKTDNSYSECTTKVQKAQKTLDAINPALKQNSEVLMPKDCPAGQVRSGDGCVADPKVKSADDPRDRTPPYSGPSGSTYSPGGNNPQVGANNTLQSPFGGPCNTRYVCSGNTLYYQSQSLTSAQPMIVQCVTQPMQQCQYGCQQMNGATGATGQTGIGSIMQMLPAITSVMNLLGGGGGTNNTSMVNPNLSSSCATSQQQQQSQYGTGTNGQPCTQPPQQPDPSQCTSGTWKPTSATQNGCTTGWQCVPNSSTGSGTGSTQPTAQLSCQPKIADVGMQIGFSWSCGNASASAGTGFDTGGQVSGNTTSVAPTPPANSNNTATYTLTCVNQGVTASAQCQVQIGNSGIVMVANPQKVRPGGVSQIGWVTSGMQSCVVSSPDQNDFTQKNASNTNVNGSAQTSPIAKTSQYILTCTTVGGQTRTASTSVEMY